MSNLSTTDKTLDVATCGDIREDLPSHGAPFQGADPELLELSSEEGEIREDPEPSPSEEGDIREVPKLGKRRHSLDEQSAAKRIRGPEPNAFKFSEIFHVRNRLNCIISVNDSTPFGNLETVTQGWMIRMFMDPGRYGSPTITLSFSYDGGKEQWRSTWDVDSYVQGEWAMDELTFARISGRDPLLFSHYDYRAMMACGASKASLMSMKFKSWARSSSRLPAQKQSMQFPKSSRASLKAIFCPEESYMLTIWFVAPGDVVDFQQNCLGVYTRALAARRPPLYHFKDDFGARFSPSKASGRRKLKALGEDKQEFAPEASVAMDFEEGEGEPEGSTISRGDKIPEPHSSPKNGSGSLMASHGSEGAPLDLETRPKGSANPDDQTELILTTERPSSLLAPEETASYSSKFVLRENSHPLPREYERAHLLTNYERAVPSFLFGAFHRDDESEDDSADGSEG